MLEHYNASVGEDQDFLDKAGVIMDETKPDGTEANYVDLKIRYNLKKAVATRNRSLALSFFKRADKTRYGEL